MAQANVGCCSSVKGFRADLLLSLNVIVAQTLNWLVSDQGRKKGGHASLSTCSYCAAKGVLSFKPFHGRLLTNSVSEIRQGSSRAVNLLQTLSRSSNNRLCLILTIRLFLCLASELAKKKLETTLGRVIPLTPLTFPGSEERGFTPKHEPNKGPILILARQLDDNPLHCSKYSEIQGKLHVEDKNAKHFYGQRNAYLLWLGGSQTRM